jgi:hypothetical protein
MGKEKIKIHKGMGEAKGAVWKSVVEGNLCMRVGVLVV